MFAASIDRLLALRVLPDGNNSHQLIQQALLMAYKGVATVSNSDRQR